jgi:hypothetical protein
MLSAVEFDNQFYCRCIEVGDVVAEGLLPVELHAANLFSPEAVPQLKFGIGWIGTQGASFGFEPSIVG